MKILFSPSEGKRFGGRKDSGLDISALLFAKGSDIRERVLERYAEILSSGDMKLLSSLFGIRSHEDIARYASIDPFSSPVMKALYRYDGVSYDYLDSSTLDSDAISYLEENMIIFSNLFGPLRASDKIPFYRMKQGSTLDGLKTEKLYKEAFSKLLDELLQNEDILDLRAAFYNRFYKASRSFTTLRFIKDGKVVSHWAKAYRGIVARTCAQNGIESMEEFLSMPIEGLRVLEISEKSLEREIVYEIDPSFSR